MPSEIVSLLLLCMLFMHACNARPLGVSSLRLEDQKMLRGHSKSGIEVIVEGGSTLESLSASKVIEHEDSSTGNEAIVSRSSDQINSHVSEWKTIRRQVGEVKAETGPRYGTVDDNTMDSAEGDVGEDVVVMDYAQPHRKPPIHNEKP